MPFPLLAPTLSDVSDASPPPYGIEVSWSANLAYRVTSSLSPGSYRVYYVQNESGPPYNGTDAGSGTLPSPVEAGTATTFILDNLQPAAPAPDTPQLLSAGALNQSVALTWSAVSEATAYQVYWGITSIDENSSDVGDVTTFTVTGLANDATYLFAVSALQEPVYHVSVTSLDNTQNRNESDFSPGGHAGYRTERGRSPVEHVECESGHHDCVSRSPGQGVFHCHGGLRRRLGGRSPGAA